MTRSLRDALLEAVLPPPGPDWPAPTRLEREAFWVRFEAVAPLHLKLALSCSAVVVAALLPVALGHRSSLAALTPEERERVLDRARALPLVGELLDVVKLVACLAYFDDPRVQHHAREVVR